MSSEEVSGGGYSRQPFVCTHDATSEPDPDGWVICWGCANAIMRRLTREQLLDRLEDDRP